MITTLAALVGLSAGAYALHDLFNVMILQFMIHVHRVSQIRFAEAHAKLMCDPERIEILIEEVTETVIEVTGPFLNE